MGRSLDLSLTSTKPVTEQHLLDHAEPLIYINIHANCEAMLWCMLLFNHAALGPRRLLVSY